MAPQFFKKKSETFCSKKVAARFFLALRKLAGQLQTSDVEKKISEVEKKILVVEKKNFRS